MTARKAGILACLAVIGGALPWLASFGSVSLLENYPGLPLLIGQSLVMPIVAVAMWFLARRLWPEISRLSALLMIAGVWFVPGVWILLSADRSLGHPTTSLGIASFLAGSPLILSAYMLNSIGLIATVLALAIVATWPRRKISHGA